VLPTGLVASGLNVLRSAKNDGVKINTVNIMTMDYGAGVKVAEVSMWSVARDNGNSAGAHYASSDSSGIAQHPYDFSAIFHQFDLHA
jgi:hypothetical protein